jgi:hypothetical protein
MENRQLAGAGAHLAAMLVTSWRDFMPMDGQYSQWVGGSGAKVNVGLFKES